MKDKGFLLYIALLILTIVLSIIFLCSCTENTRSRVWGGKMTIELPKGQKLIEATWKEQSLWYLTEPMEADYVPKTKIFQEDSRFEVFEGRVVFIESK